jgi:glycine amidinotransferase
MFLGALGRSKHTSSPCPVNCYNEWDPLEEVVVGRIDEYCVPPLTWEVKAVVSEKHWPFFMRSGGKGFPVELFEKAKKEIENFCAVLEGEGVRVRRPDVHRFDENYKTPDFSSPVGVYRGMPRLDGTV